MGNFQLWDRGQSSVLGVALLFAIVISVSASVVLIGTQALDQRERATAMEGATASFQQLDADLSRVATGSQQQVSVPDLGDGAATVQGDRGHVTIQLNTTDGSNDNCTVVDADLGRVVYEQSDRVLAYQGGGVFARSDGAANSTVLSAPEFQYQSRNGRPTLSMPLILVEGRSSGGDLSLQRASRQARFPAESCSAVSNPIVENYNVTVTIQSEFYRSWGQAIDDQVGLTPEYDHSNDEVTIEIGGDVSASSGNTIDGAISTQSDLGITNFGRLDSYSGSPYSGPPTGQSAHVGVDGDFDPTSDPEIRGDLNVTGTIDTTNTLEVHGRTVAGGTPGSGPVDTLGGGSGNTFHGNFSTTDDLHVDSGHEFESDLLIGGAASGDFRPARIGGDLYVHGGIPSGVYTDVSELQGSLHAGDDTYVSSWGTSNHVHGDVYVDGDLYLRGQSVTFHDPDAEVHATGDVYVKGPDTVTADVYAGEDVHVGPDGQSPEVDGDVHAGDAIHNSGTITGTTEQGPSATDPTPPTVPAVSSPTVDVPPSASSAIASNKTEISSTNNNSDAPIAAIESENGCDATDCELESGRYDLDELQITDGGTASDPALELDTSDGDIEIFVENKVWIKDRIEVTGENDVRIYTKGDMTVESNSANVSTPDGDASQLWVYLEPDATVELKAGNPVFTGVIYGAGPGAGSGAEVYLTNYAEVYGAVVGDITGFNSNAAIHYDEGLAARSPFDSDGISGDRSADTVAYFHVSTTTVEASN
ncbi:DUF7289 family protein [Halomicrobium salinisoli]|uniref:DUF7289 family protein n=1 Tax=Halomicrobium salinisoli TaxID=2878391 RepID=UPI001CF002C4|nr:polymer-forming cytoskeletal protein [Halomicrobium salinisoli]